MNGFMLLDQRPDLLPHKYRPDSAEKFIFHEEQATRLKNWIQEFIRISNGKEIYPNPGHDDTSSCSESSETVSPFNKSVLITGPPGVGKTSLVYTVVGELKLHIIEAHCSEKRDSKLFTSLKLTNQKGKINSLAKLFQAAANQQQQQQTLRRKRRKLTELTVENQSQSLSVSVDTSIVLFDDIDVAFEEDGPFLKSLVEFIRETKRPVILTATQSLDSLKNALVHFEHIHLDRPIIENCVKLLKDVCKLESYNGLRNKDTGCSTIARALNCDIRQCLNRIHFFGNQADQHVDINLLNKPTQPDISRLNLVDVESNDDSILKCYTINSTIDIMTNSFNITDHTTRLKRWLSNVPSSSNEVNTFGHELGSQILESIIQLTRDLYHKELRTDNDLTQEHLNISNSKDLFLSSSQRINEKIQSRIEPPEKEFFTDIVPLFGEIVDSELKRRLASNVNGGGTRRSRRVPSYLDSAMIYLEPLDFELISETLFKDQDLDSNKSE